MSQTIRKYEAWFEKSSCMEVGAFVGGDERGACIQLTTTNDFVCLTEAQALDLISVIARRIKGGDVWNATGSGSEEAMIRPDGSKCPM